MEGLNMGLIETYEVMDYKRQHVKHKLMDLKFYQIRVKEINEKMEKVRLKLDNGGLKSPQFNNLNDFGSVGDKGNWIIEALYQEEKLSKELHEVQKQIDDIESFFSILDQTELEVVKHYVIKRQCKDLEHAAFELNITNARTISRIVSRALTKIAMTF